MRTIVFVCIVAALVLAGSRPVLAQSLPHSYLNPQELVVSRNGIVVRNNGNIGIGTANPTAELEVDVRAKFSKVVTFENRVTENAAIDWSQGNIQRLEVTDDAVTVSFENPPGPANLVLYVVHSGTGALTWPATGILWPSAVSPNLGTTAGNRDMIGFFFDGTTYYGLGVTNYSVAP